MHVVRKQIVDFKNFFLINNYHIVLWNFYEILYLLLQKNLVLNIFQKGISAVFLYCLCQYIGNILALNCKTMVCVGRAPRTNQSEQHSVSSILNQTCFDLYFNNHLLYGFVYTIHFHSKCICRPKSIKGKRLTNYV